MQGHTGHEKKQKKNNKIRLNQFFFSFFFYFHIYFASSVFYRFLDTLLDSFYGFKKRNTDGVIVSRVCDLTTSLLLLQPLTHI